MGHSLRYILTVLEMYEYSLNLLNVTYTDLIRL